MFGLTVGGTSRSFASSKKAWEPNSVAGGWVRYKNWQFNEMDLK